MNAPALAGADTCHHSDYAAAVRRAAVASLAAQGSSVVVVVAWVAAAAAVNPWEPHYHRNLAFLARAKSDWLSARKYTDEWLRLEPSNIDARRMRVEYLLRDGKRADAAAEFARIEKLNPKDLDALREWYKVLSNPGP